MVDYGSYYVQPNQSQGFNALNNAIQFKAERNQQDFRNNLLQRGSDMEMQRGERAERRLDLQEKNQSNESELKLMMIQSDVLGKGLEGVTDEQSYQSYLSFLKQIAPTPMGQSKYFQSVVQNAPERFDAQKISEARKAFNSMREKVADKLQGSHQTFYDEKNTPYRKWVNAGEDLVLPPGHKTGDQIKADAAQKRKETGGAGGGSTSPEDKKAKTEILALTKISDIYKNMSDPKKGIGWKPGKEIPPEYLDQINALRKSVNKPPLTKKEASVQAEFAWYNPTTWDRSKDGVVYTEDGAAQPEKIAKDDTTRNDGTKKGNGYLGPLKRPDGMVSTEISVGVNFDGQEREIPLLVPTLTQKEIDHLLSGAKETPEILRKAVDHAQKRLSQGKSPFADASESPNPDTGIDIGSLIERGKKLRSR